MSKESNAFVRPAHEPAREALVPAHVVASWPAGTFVENVVARSDGALIASLLSRRELCVIEPGSEPRTFASLPGAPTGLSLIDDEVFVSAGELAQPGWSIYRVEASGRVQPVVEIAQALLLNGSTPFRRTSMLVVDSLLGQVFEVDWQRGSHRLWLDHELLHKTTADPMLPGVNGIKLLPASAHRLGYVYLSSTERSLLLRAAIEPDGSAGPVEIVAERLLADDFAFDTQGNLYVATHVYNQLMRVSPRGERCVLAGLDEHMHGATAACFGRGSDDQTALYVTTTGGIVAPHDGKVREAKLVRLEVGARGAPLAGI